MGVPDRLLSLRRAVEYGKAEGKQNLIVNLELLDLLLRGELPVGGNELPPEDVTRLLYEVKAARDAAVRENGLLFGEREQAKRELSAEREKRRAAEAKLAEVTKERDEAHDALRSLACWLSVGGYNADKVDAATFERKIRDGVDEIIKVETNRARGPRISDTEETALLRRASEEFSARLSAEREKRRAAEGREAELREALRAFTKFNCEWEYDSARPEDWLHGWALKDDLQRAEKLVLNLADLAQPAGDRAAGAVGEKP